jgi:hypothetical protein
MDAKDSRLRGNDECRLFKGLVNNYCLLDFNAGFFGQGFAGDILKIDALLGSNALLQASLSENWWILLLG